MRTHLLHPPRHTGAKDNHAARGFGAIVMAQFFLCGRSPLCLRHEICTPTFYEWLVYNIQRHNRELALLIQRERPMGPPEKPLIAKTHGSDVALSEQPNGHGYQAEQQALLNRLRRIEGQVRGIQRMVADDRYCVDILQQMAAITSGLQEVSLIVLRGHIEGCVSEAIRSGEEEELIEELMNAIRNGVGRWVVPPHTASIPDPISETVRQEE